MAARVVVPKPLDNQQRITAIKHSLRLVKLVYQSQPRLTALLVAFIGLKAAVPVSVLWLGKLIIEHLEQHLRGSSALDPQYLTTLIVAECLLVTLGEAVARVITLLETVVSGTCSAQISVDLMAHATKLDIAQLEDARMHDRLERAIDRITGKFGVVTQIVALLPQIVTLASLTVVLYLYQPALLLLLLIAVSPSFLSEAHLAGLGYSVFKRRTPDQRLMEYLRWLAVDVRAAREVKVFALAQLLLKRFSDLTRTLLMDDKKLASYRALLTTGTAAVSALAYYAGYAWIVYATAMRHESAGGPFTIGVLTFLSTSFHQSRQLTHAILTSLSRFYQQGLLIQDLFEFMDLRPRTHSGIALVNAGSRSPTGLEFQNVSFRYSGTTQWALHDLSFRIGPAEHVALVGENGAGKSTVAMLVARLYDPTEGRVLLDGVDLRDYDLQVLHRKIAAVFQDFVRYEFSLRDNIAVGRVDQWDNDDLVRQAARLSLATQVVTRLPDGYGQQLGRLFMNGVELSGGEWQRIAIARAYMRDASILLLDEPTSALDARAEFAAFRRCLELSRDRMVLLISHRFSTVRSADRILVLQAGSLAEQGTHAELVSARGIYAELFSLQAGGILDPLRSKAGVPD